LIGLINIPEQNAKRISTLILLLKVLEIFLLFLVMKSFAKTTVYK